MLLAALLMSACAEAERLQIKVSGHNAWVEVANTPEARRRGLMHRRQLGPDQGMLFVFPGEEIRQMWMSNTVIPLDAGFFDADGVLINTVGMDPDGGREIHRSSAPAHYVLEMNRGWFRRLGIGPGAFLQLPGPIKGH